MSVSLLFVLTIILGLAVALIMLVESDLDATSRSQELLFNYEIGDQVWRGDTCYRVVPAELCFCRKRFCDHLDFIPEE